MGLTVATLCLNHLAVDVVRRTVIKLLFGVSVKTYEFDHDSGEAQGQLAYVIGSAAL